MVRRAVREHRSFALLLVATVGTFAGYSLLLPVVPLWAEAGGAGSTGAGASTAVFMLTTVVTQLAMPVLLARFSARDLLVAGSVIMAVLSAAFAASSQLWAVMTVSALRGVGFGLVTVTGSLLIAVLLPERERGRGSGLYGAAVGLPNVAGLPAGVWLAGHLGHEEVFALAGAAGLGGALITVGVRAPSRRQGVEATGADAVPDGRGRRSPKSVLPDAALVLPAMPLITTALATGGLVTFLAVAMPDTGVVAWALFLFGLCVIAGRWSAGSLSDRLRRPVALAPGIVAAAAGMTGLAAAAAGASSAMALAGAAVFGAGFGAVQNDILIALFQRAGPRGLGHASAVWNIAYDGGFGVGAIGVGAVATAADFGVAYVATAVIVVATLPAAVTHRLRRRQRPGA